MRRLRYCSFGKLRKTLRSRGPDKLRGLSVPHPLCSFRSDRLREKNAGTSRAQQD